MGRSAAVRAVERQEWAMAPSLRRRDEGEGDTEVMWSGTGPVGKDGGGGLARGKGDKGVV